jgi:hypothetical protein
MHVLLFDSNWTSRLLSDPKIQQCELVRIRVIHLQGIELYESPYDQPTSVTQLTSADPLLVFQLPRVFSPSALTMPLHGLLSHTST